MKTSDIGLNVQSINPTEERKFSLLFSLLKHPAGLNKESILQKIPVYHSTKNPESQEKQLLRDIKDLKDMGIPIVSIRSKNQTIYKIQSQFKSPKISFSKEELKSISKAILNYDPQKKFSADVYSLCQKLFGSEWDLYPYFPSQYKQAKGFPSQVKIFNELIHAIQTKTDIKIQYEREFGKPTTKHLIPLSLIRKNAKDSYLYAYDKDKNSYRYYLIPCIQSIELLNQPSIIPPNYKKKQKPPLDQLHPLNFSNTDPIHCTIRMSSEAVHHFVTHLPKANYQLSQETITLTTTNPEALYPILFKFRNFLIELNPKQILEGYEKFLNTILKYHKSM